MICLSCAGLGICKVQGLQITCITCQGMGVVAASPESRLRIVLEQIASGSPALHCNASGDHPCAQCAAYIDLARDVLGWAKLPAQARTPA